MCPRIGKKQQKTCRFVAPCFLFKSPKRASEPRPPHVGGSRLESRGWALTAHRAQGASLDSAVAVLRGLFSPGQARAARRGRGATPDPPTSRHRRSRPCHWKPFHPNKTKQNNIQAADTDPTKPKPLEWFLFWRHVSISGFAESNNESTIESKQTPTPFMPFRTPMPLEVAG